MVTIQIENSTLSDTFVQTDEDLFNLLLDHFDAEKTVLVQVDESDLTAKEVEACRKFERGEMKFVDL